jgi:hypothetical protein
MTLLPRGKQKRVPSLVNHDMQRLFQRFHSRHQTLPRRSKRMSLLLATPERMLSRLRESGKSQHAPIRRARRVVRLREIIVRVRVADVQHAVRLEDVRMLAPPSQVAEQEPFGHAPGQGGWGFDVCERQGAPEADGGEAVGHAAAEGDRVAVWILVVHEVQSEVAGAGAVLFCARGVGVVGELGVEQLQVLDGEGAAVVVHLRVAVGPIIGPSAAAVEGVEVVHVGEDAVLGEGGAVGFQAQVREDAEPQPVGVWHFLVVHRADPGRDVGLLLLAQRVPEVFACYGEGEADGARFDHALVQVFHVAPELWAIGVGAADQCFDEEVRLVVLGVAGEEGC